MTKEIYYKLNDLFPVFFFSGILGLFVILGCLCLLYPQGKVPIQLIVMSFIPLMITLPPALIFGFNEKYMHRPEPIGFPQEII